MKTAVKLAPKCANEDWLLFLEEQRGGLLLKIQHLITAGEFYLFWKRLEKIIQRREVRRKYYTAVISSAEKRRYISWGHGES